jgi:hypothetical protein
MNKCSGKDSKIKILDSALKWIPVVLINAKEHEKAKIIIETLRVSSFNNC